MPQNLGFDIELPLCSPSPLWERRPNWQASLVTPASEWHGPQAR
jgi:hypothetical protein